MRAQHLAKLQQNRMRGARTPIVVIDRDRRFAHEIVFQLGAMRSLSRCSAASAPRSPLPGLGYRAKRAYGKAKHRPEFDNFVERL